MVIMGRFTSSGFTNNNNNTSGTSTTGYVDSTDLEDVNPTGMEFSLVDTITINCHVNGTNDLDNRATGNSNSYIDTNGTSEFYINYGLQDCRYDRSKRFSQATVQLEINGNIGSSQTITYNGTDIPAEGVQENIIISNGNNQSYGFASGGSYTDKYKTTNYNNGFVYSSTIYNNNIPDNLTSIFTIISRINRFL